MTTATATVITLPASEAQIVDDGYSIKAYKSLASRNGVAYNANLYHGKTLVGTIQNEGRGGNTWFSPNSAAARIDFENWVKANVEAGTIDGSYDPAELLIEVLVAEWEFAALLKRSLGKSYVIGVPHELYGFEFFNYKGRAGATLPIPTTIADVPANIVADAQRDGGKVWGSAGWIAVN